MTLETSLSIACAALSSVAVALLVILLVRRRRAIQAEVERARSFDRSIHLLEEEVATARSMAREEVTPLASGIEALREEIAALAGKVESMVESMKEEARRSASRSTAEARESTVSDPVALEHRILGETWRQFRANRENSAALDEALQDRAWAQLIDRLPDLVPADLEATFDAVMAPCREHRTFLQRIDLIPRIIDGTFPRLASDAEEVRRTRELANLLASDVANRLDFRFKSWVTDTFLPFADLYLQRYQQAQIENRNDEMESGVQVIRAVLRAASVEPIEVTPGETPFDSTRHIGRSTSNDPRFSDGVITGVVRNGFIEGGRQVIRQPEVIVNRMR